MKISFYLIFLLSSTKILPKNKDIVEAFKPYFYLHPKEEYYPMKVEDYYTGKNTKMVYEKNHQSRDYYIGNTTRKIGSQEVIFSGKNFCKQDTKKCISMEKIFDYFPNYKPFKNRDLFFVNENSVNYGNSNISDVPIYAIYKEITRDKKNIYQIQYITFFGFNGPYKIGKISLPFVQKRHLISVNAHEADIEHITVEVEKKTLRILRVYYGSHGRREGVWLGRSQLQFLKGSRRVLVYVALGGHGNYPKIGTYVRIFGFANDKTGKGKEWDPKIIKIYKKNSPNFDKSTMGWIYHKGVNGANGVSPLAKQAWFNNAKKGDLGGDQTHTFTSYCPPEKGKKWLKEKSFFSPISRIFDCTSKKAAKQVLKGRRALPP